MPSKPIQILFLAANPRDTNPLRLGEEIQSIDLALREADFREKFNLEQQWAVRVNDLQRHLLRYKPNIVHFSGHGSDASEIILEDPSGRSHPISVRALSRLFRLLRDNIRCIVLNACYSEHQARAIAKHIDCVIGMSKAIGDSAAIRFATAFYRALGYGRNVKDAFELGCNQIDLANLDEQETPQLLCNIDPKDIVFVQIPPVDKVEKANEHRVVSSSPMYPSFDRLIEECSSTIELLTKFLEKPSIDRFGRLDDEIVWSRLAELWWSLQPVWRKYRDVDRSIGHEFPDLGEIVHVISELRKEGDKLRPNSERIRYRDRSMDIENQ